MQQFFRKTKPDFEYCFYIETSEALNAQELETLNWLLAETFEPQNFKDRSFFISENSSIVEVGPRLNFETAFSTNAVAICRACGLQKITRLERSRRYLLPAAENQPEFIAKNHDRMTECQYLTPLKTFITGLKPAQTYIVPLIEEGPAALKKINYELGLGMDDWDINFYHDLFVNKIKRNPTNVECFQLGQANSEHSRHWFFKGKLIIDGEEIPETLFEIVKATLSANPTNSLIAFKDNSSAIAGYQILTILPQNPGAGSPFIKQQLTYHLLFTAETHNFPSGVAPFPGAETGTGGRIRDVQATGRGGLVVAGTVGYCTGNLNIADYPLPGEDIAFAYPKNLAAPLKILIEESNGASDYGNKFGEPVIQGFTRTFGLRLPNNERYEWLKPIMFTGGVGQIDSRHLDKEKPKTGMLVIQIGGPAYRIGIGGGAASSMIQGQNQENLDFNAVQRGDAEMKQKVNRVIRACVEMGKQNPILNIHDQGAGGPCNVLTEIVDPAGGKIEIRQIQVGDQTMSVLEIWGGEYQERNALLIAPENLDKFQAICQREKVNCEILGEITGDGKIVVHDRQDNSTPVDLNLEQILSKMPQKTFTFNRLPKKLNPLQLPPGQPLEEIIRKVFQLPAVGSKGFLVRKVDRSVTGLIARQQSCGPLQLPVSDVAVVAQSHFGLTGAAIAIGEQPIKMLINPAAGARLAVGEMLTNLVWAKINGLKDIKCSANWMWAAKLPGEGPKLYAAAKAMADLMISLGIAVDGGKDSLSMAAKVGEEIVKTPGQLVISGYVSLPDITQVITPDLKQAGQSKLRLISLAPQKKRLGGSALAQVFGQIGNEAPDVDDPELLKRTFLAVQKMIGQNLILAGHDISDGGLITALAEMAMAGNCGLTVKLAREANLIPWLFAEELGLIIEYLPEQEEKINDILNEFDIDFETLGTTEIQKQVKIYQGEKLELEIATPRLLAWWQATSDRLEQEQMAINLAKQQAQSYDRNGPTYQVSFSPAPTPDEILTRPDKPKVAILREEGSNGDREMTAAFFQAGFEPWDVTMTDLMTGQISLDMFRGLVFVGGFSYADVLDSAKGWAGIIKFNPRLREMFDRFYNRPDTFSLGVCNGCQLMALLGWVPWPNIPEIDQPRFIRNPSKRFESHWVTVKINQSPAIMLKEMADSVLGIWVAHGEGQLYCPNKQILAKAVRENLTPIVYVNDQRMPTEQYPFNPNGSPLGITALCSPDGRHLAMMPHPERVFLTWQWPWLPAKLKTELKASPWLKIFQNARQWCEEKPAQKNLYAQEVINPGDRASRLAKEICFQSHQNCPAVKVVPHQPDNFRGAVGFVWQKHILEKMIAGEMFEEIENDGAGGKPQFHTLLGLPETWQNLGWEIIAMTADDFARTGRFPAVIDNEINIKQLSEENFHLFQTMIIGYGQALKEAGLVNITGEIAIMKHSLTAFCDTGSKEQLILTWGAACTGLSHRDLLIDGSGIKPNLPIVGFWEPGYRCNGGTFFTNLILKKFGPEIEKIKNNPEAMAFIKKLTTPSLSYAKTICRIIGWQPDGNIGEPLAKIQGLAHITGGGVWGKFGEILPKGVGAYLNSLPEPATVLLAAQELSWGTDLQLTDYQAYGTLHGGCGMMVIAADNQAAEKIIAEAAKDNIKAQIIGRTIESSSQEIIIVSRFKEGKTLSANNLQ